MNTIDPSPLLPEFLKKPNVLAWVNLLPQTILLILNLHAYSVVNDEIDERVRLSAYTVVSIETGLLLVALGLMLILIYQKRSYAWGWNWLFLISQIGYLWLAMTSIPSIIPGRIEPWIISATNVLAYQFAFMMPGLFYAGLRLACFDVNIRQRAQFGIWLLVTILAPTLLYLYFLTIQRWLRHSAGYQFTEMVSIIFMVGATVVTVTGMLRLALMLWDRVHHGNRWTHIICAAFVGIVGPIGGLWLNRKIPFPVDFQSPFIYVLAVANGLILLIPNKKAAVRYRKIIVFLRSMAYPFTVYFFVVFLPFLPLALLAIYAVGFGFLILTPIVLFLFHTKSLVDDFQGCVSKSGLAFTTVVFVVGLSVLPGLMLAQALYDRVSLHDALAYVYSPDLSSDQQFNGSTKSVKRTLVRLTRLKRGIQLPYLAGLYNRIVFDGMVLPDRKIKEMYQLFSGDELPKIDRKSINWGFMLGNRNHWRQWMRPIQAGALREADLSSVNIASETESDIVESTVTLEIKNNSGVAAAEFKTSIQFPPGVVITGYRLKVADKYVPGQIFEKRTALWVYHMIRDFTRRDPGILVFKSPSQIELNIFPFAVDETRFTEIDFQFPRQCAPSITIGDKTVDLISHKEAQQNLSIATGLGESGDFLAVVPRKKMATLPYFQRKPYLHFILDFSQNSASQSPHYAKRIQSIASQFDNVRTAKISAANFEVEVLTDKRIELTDVSTISQTIEYSRLPSQGSLDLERVLKRELVMCKMMWSRSSTESEWNVYPIFVVLTSQNACILDPKNMDYFRSIVPEINTYFLSKQENHLEEIPLWSNQQNVKTDDVICFKFGDVVSIIPATNTMQATYFQAQGLNATVENNGNLSVYNPESGRFTRIEDTYRLDDKSIYLQGLALLRKNYENLINPATLNTKLPSLLKTSRQLGVMIPSTSYIVVERSSQWKALNAREKQRLRGAEGLEFEETFETPEPALWLMILLVLAMYYLKTIWKDKQYWLTSAKRLKKLCRCRCSQFLGSVYRGDNFVRISFKYY